MRRKRKLFSWKGIFVRKIQNLFFCRRMQVAQRIVFVMTIICGVLCSLIFSAFCQVVEAEETANSFQSVRDRLRGVSVLEGYGRSHHQGFLNVRKVPEKVTLPVPLPPPPTSVPVLRRWDNLAQIERNESGAHVGSWLGLSSSGDGAGHFHAGNGSNEKGGSGIPRKIEAIIPVHSKTHYLATLLARSLAPFFSVTSLWKEKCWSTKYEQGTCLSKKECQSRGGSAGGLCAGGFGVCCVFSYSCDSTTGLNRTYFVNPEFPFSISKSGASCHHEIRNLEGICQIRLDFEEFRLEPPGPDGTCWQDSFSVYGVDARLPPLCGDLSGQHAYLPVAFVHSINYVMVLTGEVPWRRWKIRTVKIPCNSPSLAPGGCLQNFQGASGRFTSFNYHGPAVHSSIDGLNYGVCVRRERGMCAIKWSQCDMNQAEHYDYEHHHEAFRRKRSVRLKQNAEPGNATSPTRSSTRSRSLGAISHYWSQMHSEEVQEETNNFPVSSYPSGVNLRNSLIPKWVHSASSKWRPLVMGSPKPEVGRNTKTNVVDVNNLVAKIPLKAVVDKLKEITKERNKEKLPIGASSKYKIKKPIKLKLPGGSLSKNKWKVPSVPKIKIPSRIKQKGDHGNSNFKSKIKKWISSLKSKKAAKAKAKKNKKKNWKYKSKGKKGKKRRKNKKRRKGLCGIPFPFPFPVALPFPLLGALGAGAGAGAGGGGGGGGAGGGLFGGSGWHSEDGSVTTSVEPYLVRVVTNQEQPEGLRPVCIDYYQVPCESFDGGGGGWSV